MNAGVQPRAAAAPLPRNVKLLGWASFANDVASEMINFAVGVATLPASMLFGWLYQACGPAAAFGWGAALALVAATVLALPGRQRSRVAP